MRSRFLASILVLAGAGYSLSAAPAPVQPGADVAPAATPPAAAHTAALRIRGSGVKDLDLTLADLKAMPHRTITVKDKDEKLVAYSGVVIEDILAKAGLAFGQALRGPKLRDYLLAEAGDGYAVVFALLEISTEFSDRVVMIADAAADSPLAGREGPLKVIVSDEKKHARWVRDVVALTMHTCETEKK